MINHFKLTKPIYSGLCQHCDRWGQGPVIIIFTASSTLLNTEEMYTKGSEIS